VDQQAWIKKGLDAGRVFTPTSPIDEKSLFAGRIEQIRAIIDVINQKGQHAIVYGERGVGKTSLVSVLSGYLEAPSVMAPRVNCDSTDSFETVWKKAFEQIELSRFQAGVGFTANAQFDKFRSSELLGESITPDSVRRALTVLSSNALTIFIIDEFDRLSQEPRHAFADTIKALSDHAVPATVIIVGVSDSVSGLIAEHQSVERALVQVQMPRMSNEEVKQIIRTGVKKLRMKVLTPALRQIANLSQGLPHYAHLLGLYSVRSATDSRVLDIGPDIVRKAIEKSIKGANQSIRTSYDLAVRSARKDNLFSNVLLSCALANTSDLGYFAAQGVRDPMKKITGKSYEITSYAQHLNEFCDEKRGPILQKTGTQRMYRYRFINPLMQPFVIMQGIQSGQIASSILD